MTCSSPCNAGATRTLAADRTPTPGVPPDLTASPANDQRCDSRPGRRGGWFCCYLAGLASLYTYAATARCLSGVSGAPPNGGITPRYCLGCLTPAPTFPLMAPQLPALGGPGGSGGGG